MFVNAFFDPALDGAVSVATTASLHTADPGTTGTNEVSGEGYARQAVTWAAASGGQVQSATAVTFNVPGSTTVTHVGLWSAAGTWLGSLELDAPETFAGAGTLEIMPMTITATNA